VAEKLMRTSFIVDDHSDEELYIYRVPECQMCRLHKGDAIRLRKYTKGYPFNDLERWEAVVTEEPTFDLNWSDHADPGRFAYDGDSVIPVQVVRIEIKSHKWV